MAASNHFARIVLSFYLGLLCMGSVFYHRHHVVIKSRLARSS
jgi:hypothetical protein